MKNNKGQAIIETAIFIPILAIISVLSFWAADIMLTKQQLLLGARFGTDMLYYTNRTDKNIKKFIIDYLTNPPSGLKYRTIDPSKIISIDITDNRKKSDIYNATDFSVVSIKYIIKTPKILNFFLKFYKHNKKNNNTVKDQIIIESHSAVLAGLKKYSLTDSVKKFINSMIKK